VFGRNRLHKLPGLSRRKIPREGIIVASLDVGAAKTVCFIARLTPFGDGSIECDVIGAGHFGARLNGEHPTRNAWSEHGLHTANIETTPKPDYRLPPSLAHRERAIRSAVDAAEAMAGERITEVHVCVPAQALVCVRVGVDLAIAGGFVTSDDIRDSVLEGSTLTAAQGCTALSVAPIAYAIDGERVGIDPRGLRGQTLTTYVLGVNAQTNAIGTLTAAVESAGLKVASFIAAPIASSEATLIDDEKDLGVLAIDIGAHATGYALYTEGRLTGCGGCLPGAGFITRDIAEAFSTPLNHAERQKILHGTVLSSAGDDHRFVDMIGFTADDPRARVSRADMTEVIQPRMEEIYEALTNKLVSDQLDLSSLRRVVFTGGGSQLHGVCDHAERAFSMKARIGKPGGLDGLPEALTGPAFSAGLGVLHHLARLWGPAAPFAEADSSETMTPATGTQGSVSGGGWKRLRF